VKEPSDNKILQTSKSASESGWNVRAHTTLVVNNLVGPSAVRHDGIVCKGTAHPGDVRLVGAIIALRCVVACLPSAVAADYEPLEGFGRGGCGRLGCHRESLRCW